MQSINSKNKIIIITGITSYLARESAKKLIKEGYIVFGLTYKESKNLEKVKNIKGLILIYLDFENIDFKNLVRLSNYFSDVESNISYKSCDKKVPPKNYDEVRCEKKLENQNLSINKYKNIDNELNLDKKTFENIKLLREKNITLLHFAWLGSNASDRANEDIQIKSYLYSYKVLLFSKILNVKKFIFMGSQAENTSSFYGEYKKKFAEIIYENIDANKRLIKKDGFYKNLNFIHLKIFSIYGYGMGGRLLPSYLKSIKEKEKNFDLGSCEKKWNFLYIDDFTEIILRLISKINKSVEYDVGSEDTRNLKNFILEIKEIFKSDINLNFGKFVENGETQSLPNITNLKKDIGKIKWTTFNEGIRKFYKSII